MCPGSAAPVLWIHASLVTGEELGELGRRRLIVDGAFERGVKSHWFAAFVKVSLHLLQACLG